MMLSALGTAADAARPSVTWRVAGTRRGTRRQEGSVGNDLGPWAAATWRDRGRRASERSRGRRDGGDGGESR